ISFVHYKEKLEKLEYKHKTAGANSKDEEKIVRNQQKLKEAEVERDAYKDKLVQQLEAISSNSLRRMNPIYRYIFLFQQEWFKQSSTALEEKSTEIKQSETSLSGIVTTSKSLLP